MSLINEKRCISDKIRSPLKCFFLAVPLKCFHLFAPWLRSSTYFEYVLSFLTGVTLAQNTQSSHVVLKRASQNVRTLCTLLICVVSVLVYLIFFVLLIKPINSQRNSFRTEGNYKKKQQCKGK